MASRKLRLTMLAAGLLLIGFIISLQNCSGRRMILTSFAPDRQAKVIVEIDEGGWGLDSHSIGFTFITLVSPAGTVVLQDDRNGESRPRFVTVSWSADSKIVGVLQCTTFQTVEVMGYDLASDAVLAVGKVLPMLESAVVSEYFEGRPPLGDECSAVCWVCMDEAARLFARKNGMSSGEMRPRAKGGARVPIRTDICPMPLPCKQPGGTMQR